MVGNYLSPALKLTCEQHALSRKSEHRCSSNTIAGLLYLATLAHSLDLEGVLLWKDTVALLVDGSSLEHIQVQPATQKCVVVHCQTTHAEVQVSIVYNLAPAAGTA